jgi:hypothetical protein
MLGTEKEGPAAAVIFWEDSFKKNFWTHPRIKLLEKDV